MPPFWRRVRALNCEGPPLVGAVRDVAPLPAAEFERRMKDGAVVLDCRSPEAFGGGHIPGALNVGPGPQFPVWAGTVLPEAAPVLLVLDENARPMEVAWSLLRIGHELPRGSLRGGMLTWRSSGRPLARLPQWTAPELSAALAREPDLMLLDVRQPQEWTAGHVEGARHITAAALPERIAEIPSDRPVAVVCSSGYRSSVSASLLLRHGHRRVFNVLGGMSAWKHAGFPTVNGGPARERGAAA